MSHWLDGRVDDIRARLEGISEELAELSIEVLRDAVEQGARERPATERTLTKARRAVEKAAHLLDS